MQLASKRLRDIAISILLLALTAPVTLAVAIAIKLDSPGPVFFRQERVGHNGVTFQIVKFRTMHHRSDEGIHRRHCERLANVESHAAIRIGRDPRITRVGATVRRWSLDELPNLWNVLRGQMSLVGPRPLVPYEIDMLEAESRRRLTVKPGVTGWAQVNGRLDVTLEQRTDLDLAYLTDCSMRRDLGILLMTIPAVFKRSGG